MTGRWPRKQIDHRDGDTLNDRWGNLREATRVQNEANRGARRNNRSGAKGVVQYGNYFAAFIYRRRRKRYIGRYDTLEEAAAAHRAEAAKYDGEFLWCVEPASALPQVRS